MVKHDIRIPGGFTLHRMRMQLQSPFTVHHSPVDIQGERGEGFNTQLYKVR